MSKKKPSPESYTKAPDIFGNYTTVIYRPGYKEDRAEGYASTKSESRDKAEENFRNKKLR